MAIYFDERKAIKLRESKILFEEAITFLNSSKPLSIEQSLILYGMTRFFTKKTK